MVSEFYLIVVREPRDDENYVLTAYEGHLSRCPHCGISRGSRSEDLVLCGRGYRYARDVANYIFAQNGKYFSVVASEKGSRVQVKIPREAQGVRSLLAAIEDGLALLTQKSITGVQCNHIHQKQPNKGPLESRYQPPKLKAYKIIERKPFQINSQASPCFFLCRRPGYPKMYNTDLVGRPESQWKSRHRHQILERYPRAEA